jgi:hypothetical protein
MSPGGFMLDSTGSYPLRMRSIKPNLIASIRY